MQRLKPSGWAARGITCLVICGLTQTAFSREIELVCEDEARHSVSSHPSTGKHSARVQFNDARSRTGTPTAVKIDWQQPDRSSRFGGIAAERKVRWSGLLIRSIEVSINPKISFELLFSPSDDIYVIRRKTNGQPVAELPCRIEL